VRKKRERFRLSKKKPLGEAVKKNFWNEGGLDEKLKGSRYLFRNGLPSSRREKVQGLSARLAHGRKKEKGGEKY